MSLKRPMRSLQLKRNGYDPFIDFVKGFCILSVVLTHSLPQQIQDCSLFCLWGGLAVPIFLMIQVFHSYKYGLDSSKSILTLKILKRIVVPFLGTLFFICFLKIAKHPESINDSVLWMLKGGGGPGSYYPWVYVQFAVLLALFRPLLRKIGSGWSWIFLLLLSVVSEIFCSLVGMPEWLYRILCFRYIFLIVLGLDWVLEGVKLDFKRFALSVLSIACLVYFHYVNPNMEPIFFYSWNTYHWVCYFYAAYAFIYILNWIYVFCKEYCGIILKCGKYSYEIFLLQMIVFSYTHVEWFSFAGSRRASFVIWFVFVNLMSVIPVLLFKGFVERRIKKNGLR